MIASFGFTFGVLYGPGAFPWVDVIAGLVCLAIARRREFRTRIAYATFVIVGAFLLGLTIGVFRLPGPETITEASTLVLEGEVVEVADRGLLADGLVVDVTGTATAAGAQLTPARGRILLRLPHEDGALHPAACAAPGGRIRARVRISPRQPSLVPAFRSRRLAVRRGVQLYGEAVGPCVALDPGPAALTALQRSIAAVIRRAAPRDGGLLGALATGDRTGTELDAEARIVHAGLGYLLELYGLSMALLLFFFLFLLRRHRMRGSQLALILIVPLALLFGGTPSIIRIALLLACLLLPSLTRGRIDVFDALAIAVIAVLAVSPSALGDTRFQLAFAGTSAVVRLYPGIMEKLPRLGTIRRSLRAPLQLLLIAIAVAFGTAGLAARQFDRVSLLSFAVAPLAIGAMIGLIAPLSLIGGALAAITPALGIPPLWIAGTALEALLRILPSGGAGSIPTPTVFECIVFYGIMSSIAAPTPQVERRVTPMRVAAALSLFLIAWVGAGIWVRSAGHDLEVAVLPTPRGVADVIRLPDDAVLVRDTAPPAAWFQMEQRLVSNHLKLHRETRIDALIADPGDDLEGARELAHQFPVGEVWWTRAPADPTALESDRILDSPIQRAGTRIRSTPAGVRLELEGRSILLASTATSSMAADAVVSPDGTVTSSEGTYRTETQGMIRIRIDEGRLEVIPLVSR